MVQLRIASCSNPYYLQEKSSMIWCLPTFLTAKPWLPGKGPTGTKSEFLQLLDSSLLDGAGAWVPVMLWNGLPTLCKKLLLIPHFCCHLLYSLLLTFCAAPYRWVFFSSYFPRSLTNHSFTYVTTLSAYLSTSPSSSQEFFADKDSVWFCLDIADVIPRPDT